MENIRYKYLLEAITDYTTKCSVTLKSVREQIKELIKDIADTQEDYDLLMENIPRFYRDYRNANKEHIECHRKDYNMTEFETYYNVGDENAVEMPTTLKILLSNDLFIDEGVRASLHNHPSGTSFQSLGDYLNQATYTIKYNITISDEGITISKLDAKLNEVDPLNMMIIMAGFENGRNQYFYNNQNQYGIDKLKEKAQSESITPDESQEELNNIFTKYINENIETETKKVNDMFKFQDIPINVYHLDIKKTYEMG